MVLIPDPGSAKMVNIKIFLLIWFFFISNYFFFFFFIFHFDVNFHFDDLVLMIFLSFFL
jgi:hypothetical protein